jgi:hypothetical protein
LSTIKRASLPGADELFRTTSVPKEEPQEDQSTYQQIPSRHQTAAPPPARTRQQSTQRFIDKESKLQVPKQGSGRQRHEEKITFYCTQEELLALERARLALREFGVGADRGRIVREALSYTLADLDANGQASILADRLGRRR